MDYYNRTNPAQALACGYPAGMGEIPVQADGLGGSEGVSYVAGEVLFYGTPLLAGYAARKHGHGWLATFGIAVGASVLEGMLAFIVGLPALAVPVVAGYYAFKD